MSERTIEERLDWIEQSLRRLELFAYSTNYKDWTWAVVAEEEEREDTP